MPSDPLKTIPAWAEIWYSADARVSGIAVFECRFNIFTLREQMCRFCSLIRVLFSRVLETLILRRQLGTAIESRRVITASESGYGDKRRFYGTYPRIPNPILEYTLPNGFNFGK